LVEQWTENPCVAGSSPAHTTKASIYRGFCILKKMIVASWLAQTTKALAEMPRFFVSVLET